MRHAAATTSRGHDAQMTNGSGRSRRPKERSESAGDRFFLAALCPALLPAFLGPVPLLHAACSAATTVGTILSAALVYSAPMIVPLFVWNVLGKQPAFADTCLLDNRVQQLSVLHNMSSIPRPSMMCLQFARGCVNLQL